MSITELFDTMSYSPASADPGPAVGWLEAHEHKLDLFAAGEWMPAAHYIDVTNPATGETLAQAAQACPEDLANASEAARAARFDAGECLRALADAIERHTELLALLLALDAGVPIRRAREDAARAGALLLDYTNFILPGPAGAANLTAQGLPSLAAVAQHLGAALAAGRAVVFSPPLDAPLAALALADLAELLPGVLNIVPGAGLDAANRVTAAVPTCIVCEDADLDSAAAALAGGSAALLVQESISETFFEKLRAHLEALRVGDPLDANTDVGALPHYAAIGEFVTRAEQVGAVRWQAETPVTESGRFFPPTLLTGMLPGAQQKLSGPLLSAATFRTPGEAVGTVGEVDAASVWSEHLGTALDMARSISARTVWLNGVPTEAAHEDSVLDYMISTAEAAPPTVKKAVMAARSAAAWSKQPAGARADTLRALAARLEVHTDAFKEDDILQAAAKLRDCAALAETAAPSAPPHTSEALAIAVPTPRAVTGVIAKDLVRLVSLAGPALAAGSRVVAAISPDLEAFGIVLHTAGVPDGVVSLVTHEKLEAPIDVWDFDTPQEPHALMRRAVRVKIIWAPHGA